MNQLPSLKDLGGGKLLKPQMPWTQTLILRTRITDPFATFTQKITSLVSWNGRGYRSHIDYLKAIIHKYRPVYVALQETFLKSCHTAKIRRYGCCSLTPYLLQAVAVRIHSTSLFTVCCLYLPPNAVIRQQDLNDLVDQLPAPFVILGDFNGHSTLWGSVKTNHRGRQTEQVLSDHCLCLLNHEEPTHFHEPTRSFHTLDFAIRSPSLLPILNFSVQKDLYNSDHFPVILSHDYDAGGKTFPPRYSYSRADWALFTQLALISDVMVKTESVDTAVKDVTNVLIDSADLSIPKSSSHSFQRYKPWWNADCQTAYKNQRKLWGTFRRYPTTENLLAFKKAKANARRVRRQSQRQSWIRYVSSLTSSTSSKQLWKKVKAANGMYREFSFPILQTSNSVFSSPVDISNILVAYFITHLPPSVQGILYVDDLQVSCQGSDMRLIERQLQTTVNRLVKWCDQNGHTISPSKSNCVHFCRKRNLHPDTLIHIGNVQIPAGSEVRFFGVIFDCKLTILPHVLYWRKKVSLLRVYQALILSRLDYGCVVYGSARASVLKRLDAIHHSALRICSGAFRTSPVTSLYVVCHQPPLELRRRQLSANCFIRAMSVPSHPLKPFSLAIGLNRLYEARSFNIKPFSERAKAVLNDAHLSNINIQENNILAFPPWDIQILIIVTFFQAITKQALWRLFISSSFLFIAVSFLSTYQSTWTGRRLQDMLDVVLFLTTPFLILPYIIPCLSLVLN
ncbi:putative RNA-directed DNA polymerase from transposon BS [Trichonephila clavipes]|nr:putative RNA-directed DNA polymerase from transposon BS [Trichonephila clavipes]